MNAIHTPAKKTPVTVYLALAAALVAAAGIFIVICLVALPIVSPPFAAMLHAKADPAWGDGYYAGLFRAQQEITDRRLPVGHLELLTDARGYADSLDKFGTSQKAAACNGYMSGYQQKFRRELSR